MQWSKADNNIIQDITEIELREEESEDDADGKIIPEWKQNEDTTMHSELSRGLQFHITIQM